jgi:hypothetical protein
MNPESLNESKGNIEQRKVDAGLEQFNKLKEKLANLPLPKRYTQLGINTFSDEGGGVIELWQSDEAMQRGELVDRIGRIVIDLMDGSVRVHLDSGHELDPHLLANELDFKLEGVSKENQEAARETLVEAHINESLEKGEAPFNTTASGFIRDPRVQAIIDYVMALEQGGIKLDYNKDDYIDRKFAITVKEEQLSVIEGHIVEQKALADGSGQIDIVPKGASDLVAQADILRTEIEQLRELKAQADDESALKRQEFLRKQAENPTPRDRRSRRSFREDQSK